LIERIEAVSKSQRSFHATKDLKFGNLTEDRVIFGVGRDIDWRPRQAGPPLNFFVYPYVEVDDEPLGKGQIELAFRYKDVAEE
jgi:hypothetical protein